jgi:uncharacterized phiE125 gp8 family phage protein
MGLTLVTPAASPVVTLAEAKAWCRVDGDADDGALGIACAAAINAVEEFIGRSLGAQSWQLSLDAFADEIELPRGPVTAIDSFTYVDTAGSSQAVDESLYTLDLVSDPQRVVRNDGASWPTTAGRINAVTIQFTAGFSAVPSAVRLAILTLTAQVFDNRTMPALTAEMVRSLSPWRLLRI